MALKCLKPKVVTIETRRGSPPATERIRGRKLMRIRDRILLRDEYTCQDCGRVTTELEVDHIVPLHLGGAESDENRLSRCVACHARKTEAEEKGRQE